MLYLIAIILIAIPFAVGYQVDQYYEALPVQGEMERSVWPIKFGVSLLAILVTAKMFQLFNTAVVRQPILKQNPWKFLVISLNKGYLFLCVLLLLKITGDMLRP